MQPKKALFILINYIISIYILSIDKNFTKNARILHVGLPAPSPLSLAICFIHYLISMGGGQNSMIQFKCFKYEPYMGMGRHVC